MHFAGFGVIYSLPSENEEEILMGGSS